jgi:hypothetical protein
MSVKSHAARLALVARFVESFAARFEPAGLPARQRLSAAKEIDRLICLFDGQSGELEAALMSLRQRLRTAPNSSAISAVRPRAAHRGLAMLLRLLPPLATGAAIVSAAIATPAFAAITVPAVGASIVNPTTNTTETVVSIIGSPGYAVQTSGNNILLLATAVGDSFTDSNGKVQTVTAITTTTFGSGGSAVTYTTGLTLKDASNVVTSLNVVTPLGTANTAGGDGSGSTSVTFPTAAGDIGQVTNVQYGADGGDGHAGFEVCVLGFCVGYGPSSGGNGATGPTVTVEVPASHGTITTVSNNLPGIIAASVGGNGGVGGDAGGVGGSAAQGGVAGAGGTVTVKK